ncbi:MAG: hypothetical protein R2849_05865 [Thermomicrobiales bacterium]
MKLRSIERGTLYPADTQQVADDQGGLPEVDLDIPGLSISSTSGSGASTFAPLRCLAVSRATANLPMT